jgi:hypothetical protein
MAIFYDQCHIYEPEDAEHDTSADLSQNSERLNKITPTPQNQTQKFNPNKLFEEFKPTPKKIAEDLIKLELNIIKSFKVTAEDYFNSLMISLPTNKNLQKELKFISDFKNYFENDELMPINFGQIIPQIYLKIVSNIFFLNLREVSRHLKFNIYDKQISLSQNEIKDLICKVYENNLKRIR